MLDIHTHILPFVDDGSRHVDSSIKMLEEEIEIGMSGVIMTPHFDFHKYNLLADTIKKQFDEFMKEVKLSNKDFKIYLGQEIFYRNNYKEIVQMLDEGKLLTLGGTNYILLEFDPLHKVDEVDEVIYNFKRLKYNVIVAHVERYSWMNEERIVKMRNEGALIQVNAQSLLGFNGPKMKKFAKKMVKKGYVNFISSDVHSFRKNTMAKALAKYQKKINYVDFINN